MPNTAIKLKELHEELNTAPFSRLSDLHKQILVLSRKLGNI